VLQLNKTYDVQDSKSMPAPIYSLVIVVWDAIQQQK